MNNDTAPGVDAHDASSNEDIRAHGTIRPINNKANAEGSIPEGATCRICRGESTPDNPLLHPCMCKGSIKYLHEPCLLEWISARHIDINKPGETVECDICHYPFHFKIAYDDSMPDRIPIRLLFLNMLHRIYDLAVYGFNLTTVVILLCVGFPLSWNFYGKLYTFILDGALPFPGDFTKSIIFGFNKDVPDDYNNTDIALQLASNVFFSTCQIVFTIIIHLALYFQYDMIVREDIFSKMVFHKIGPNISIEAVMERLKKKFPVMDDSTLEHVARIVANKELRDQAEMHEDIEQNHVNEQADDDVQPLFNDDHSDDEGDEDFVPSDGGQHSDEDTDGSFDATGDDLDILREEVEQGVHGEEFHLENPVENLVNLRAQRQFDDMLDQHRNAMENLHNQPDFHRPQENVRFGMLGDDRAPNVPVPNARRPDIFNMNNPVFPIEEPNDDPFMGAGINDPEPNQQGQLIGAFGLNIQVNIGTVSFYFSACVAVIGLYLMVAYLVPTTIGYILGRFYYYCLALVVNSLVFSFYSLKVNVFYGWMGRKIPGMQWVNESASRIIMTFRYEISQYWNTINQKENTLMRTLPAAITYLTAIVIICLASEIICMGYGRSNGMTNTRRRFASQLLYALKCTFKVFTLFFIELAGFPILAGVMLDFSLFAPILGKVTDLLWIPSTRLVWFQDEIVYWMIGTLYMYWFAKYIGMIREHIIRPGVLYFIRSPEDPNTRILHDSLIHPMGIQLSRLGLSMFIYAVFIVVGFGFHTRVLFPLILKSKILNTPEGYLSGYVFNNLTMLIVFYFAKRIIEANPNVTNLVREYWIKIFEVSSRKLRLSSFILGADYSSERGHIVYRNMLYSILFSKRAEWSNPELYSNPKTASQAKQLFAEDKTVHAYFVPDGIQIRVPSSDIVSRNYLQTMFVPVTKADKLLKPLDLSRLREKNEKNGGEFSYLDVQNTDFDHYFVCYVPPHFRLRYMSLMALIWFFASFIIISTSIVAQYLFNTIVIIVVMLPLRLVGTRNIYLQVKEASISGFTRINVHYICLGAIIMSFMVDHYKIRHLVSIWKHVDNREPDVADNQNGAAVAEDNDEDDIPMMVERPALGEILFHNAIFRFILAPIIVCFVGILDYFTFGYVTSIVIRNCIGYGRFILWSEPMDITSVYHDLTSISYYSVDIWFRIDVLLRLIKVFRGIRQNRAAGFRFAISQQWNVVVKPHINVVKRSYITFGTLLLSAILLEYIFEGNHYNSLSELIRFMLVGRSLLSNKDIPWTFPQHYMFSSTVAILVLYFSQTLLYRISDWIRISTQSVRDNMFASGRVLENYETNVLENE
ncbi:E3 ubiquitin-protein ligase [Maudiozyma humilis]|uniref:RING-type E3 ubiquitin transferase n=1 Tax=Maudiozyma humilis TaxID=51915 RepID=A0AAV5RVE8_MAUHU|nr:E3 ubiquitin-protein ligase [Kazachstania humilis]